MSPLHLALIALRSSALVLELQGRYSTAEALYALANAAESGQAIDDHMAAVAEKLKDRASTPEDWRELISRIEQESERLQSS